MWVIVIALILVSILNYLSEKKFDSPSFAFLTTWGIVLFLFSLQFYKLQISSTTTLILIVMIVSFLLGVTLQKEMNSRNSRFYLGSSVENNGKVYNVQLKKKFFWVACIVTISVMLIDEIEIIISILSGKTFLNVIQDAGSAHTIEISGFKAMLYIFIVYPATYFISPICAAEIFSGNSRKLPYITVNLAIIILAVMHHGARLMVIVAIAVYLFTMAAYGTKIVIPSKVKKTVLIMVIIAVIAIVKISVSRGIDDVWGSFYMYFICEMPVCDGFLKSSLSSIPTRGYLSFNGIIYPLVALLKTFHYTPSEMYIHTKEVRDFLESNWIFVEGYNHNVNAFLPAGAFPYIDGGFIFEAIVFFLTGFVVERQYEKMIANKTQKNVAIYALIFIAIFLSFYRYYLTSYQYTIGLIYIMLLYDSKK